MLKSIGKTKDKAFLRFAHSIFVFITLIMVKYSITTSLPSISSLPTSYKGSHPSLKQRKLFPKPVDMQFDSAFTFVAHTEVEPLSVAHGIGIHPHVKIILKFWNPDIPITILQLQGLDSLLQIDCWIKYRVNFEFLVFSLENYSNRPPSATSYSCLMS